MTMASNEDDLRQGKRSRSKPMSEVYESQLDCSDESDNSYPDLDIDRERERHIESKGRGKNLEHLIQLHHAISDLTSLDKRKSTKQKKMAQGK